MILNIIWEGKGNPKASPRPPVLGKNSQKMA